MTKLTRTNLGTLLKGLNLKGRKDAQIMDDELRGFGVRKFASGQARFFVRYYQGETERRMSLGSASKSTLDAAREAAAKIILDAKTGSDPQAIKKLQRKRDGIALGKLIEPFLNAHATEWAPGYFADNKRYLNDYWAPLHAMAVDEIRRDDVVRVLDDIATRRGKVTADRCKAALSSFYAWAIERTPAETIPTLHVKARAKGGGRERVLSLEEMGEIWSVLDDSSDYGAILRLLMLTGQRRSEIADLSWSEFHVQKRLGPKQYPAEIELSGQRTKNGRPHIIPLSKPAADIIGARPRIAGRDYLFGEGGAGFQGWSKAKARLDAKLPRLAPWRVHDLRRSVVTHLAEAGTQPHVIEALVNHVSGTKAGIAGVYNKAEYMPERRKALNAWAERLLNIS